MCREELVVAGPDAAAAAEDCDMVGKEDVCVCVCVCVYGRVPGVPGLKMPVYL